MNKTALIILHTGFEEMEAVAPIDILRRGEVDVTVASLEKEPCVRGRNNISIVADVHLSEVEEQLFDCLILPGGPGVFDQLRGNDTVLSMTKRHSENGKLVSAICAAPLVLHDAHLLDDKRYTAHPSTQEELQALDSSAAVIQDGQLVTSRGAGTATAFALSLLSNLTNQEIADSIAESICFDGSQ